MSADTGTRRTVMQPAAEIMTGGNASPAPGKAWPPTALRQDLAAVAEQLNKASQAIGRDLRFEVDLDSGRSVIQVLDRETGEIIRQIPPEKVRPYMQENGVLAVRLYDEQV
jgi:uncharacterized FlaG/YvyC family protein